MDFPANWPITKPTPISSNLPSTPLRSSALLCDLCGSISQSLNPPIPQSLNPSNRVANETTRISKLPNNPHRHLSHDLQRAR